MSIPDKLIALFEILTKDDVLNLSPAKRRHLRDVCAHWAALADPHGHKTSETIFAEAREACEAENRRSTGVIPELRRFGRSYE